MGIEEAFNVLGLATSSRKDVIEKKFKKLIKKFHPDAQHGSHEEAITLNKAREIALEFSRTSSSDTAIAKFVYDIIISEKRESEQKEEYINKIDSIFNKASRRETSKYKRMKSQAKFVGVVSAAVALLNTKLIPVFPDITPENKTISVSFLAFAAAFGIIYTVFNYQAETIQDHIDELKESLNDKATFYEFIDKILDLQSLSGKSLYKFELEKLINSWSQSPIKKIERPLIDDAFIDMLSILSRQNPSFVRSAKIIGDSDFKKIIIMKCLENKIFTEIKHLEENKIVIKYQFS